MVSLFYEVLFFISFFLSIVYVYIWKKHFDVNITAIYLLSPIAILGYYSSEQADSLDMALLSLKLCYVGGCFLTFFITMCIFNLCQVEIKRAVRMGAFLVSAALYFGVYTIQRLPFFYKSVSMEQVDGKLRMVKEYGPMHTVFYVVVIIYSLVGIGTILYTFMKKRQVSDYILALLFIPEFTTIVLYFWNILYGRKFDLTPSGYVLAQLTYLFITHRMSLYNSGEMVMETLTQNGDTGFVSLDLKGRFLGANETAKEILPELRKLPMDCSVARLSALDKTVSHWVKHFNEDGPVKNLFAKRNPDNPDEDKFYIVDVNHLYDGYKKCGYQIILRDDTKNQQYIRLLDTYNDELAQEVDRKTQHIVEMHNNLILSMATMVESRDNSTGGHIKRTSDVVRILIDEIRKDDVFGLSEEFCSDIIKAAPMHDLGKVAVDDDILRKPGRFTDEEFEIMKTHAAKGAEIVHEILKDTDDESFKVVAENVAHYHHERMDGSGYPEGLKADQIPLEARIMAVADVYDALVSKRVYKEKMSFEKADAIMMESMGKHFDKRMERYYISAKDKLEAYYSKLD